MYPIQGSKLMFYMGHFSRTATTNDRRLHRTVISDYTSGWRARAGGLPEQGGPAGLRGRRAPGVGRDGGEEQRGEIKINMLTPYQ